MDLKELIAERLGGSKAKKTARLHMTMHPMDDGKFYVEHHMRGGEATDIADSPKQYAPAGLKELHDHIDKHYAPKEEVAENTGSGVEVVENRSEQS